MYNWSRSSITIWRWPTYRAETCRCCNPPCNNRGKYSYIVVFDCSINTPSSLLLGVNTRCYSCEVVVELRHVEGHKFSFFIDCVYFVPEKPQNTYRQWRLANLPFQLHIKFFCFVYCGHFVCQVFLMHILVHCSHSVQNLLSSSLLFKNINTKIYRTIILPVVLYGCETWSIILREEHRLRVFENRVLRRIFEPERGRVTGEWRKLNNEELMICTAHQILLG